MLIRKASCTLALTTLLLSFLPASAETTLRIAMTAADIPTATGLPNNGFEGMRFLGYPIFEGMVLWDLPKPTNWRACVPGLPRNGNRIRKTTRPGYSICAMA